MAVILIVQSDLGDVSIEVKRTEEEIRRMLPQAVHALAEYALDQWTSIAQARLSGETAERYLSGLRIEDFDPEGDLPTALVSLTGRWQNAMEHGWRERIDLKPGILASGRLGKVTSTGKRVADVPFRHMRAGNPNNPKSMPASVQTDINKAVRKAKKAGQTRARGANYKPVKKHTTGIHSGMLAQPNKAARERFKTFRRVSETSDPNKWIVPAFSGVQAGAAMRRLVDGAAPRIMAEYLGGVIR